MHFKRIETLNENKNNSIFNINIPLDYNGILLYALKKNQNHNSPLNLLHMNNNERVSTKLGSNQNNKNPFSYSYDHILSIFKKEENKKKFNDIINKMNKEIIEEQTEILEKKKNNLY